jgi:hypothetical protein
VSTDPSTDRIELVVNRRDIGRTELRTSGLGALAPGHVRVEIERWALTANNITYAQFGDMLAYWAFYPVPGDGDTWGHVPCMGWGRVTHSDVAAIEVGQRFYSWWPMATSVDILATPTASGFRDDGPHRAPHAPVYRSFTRTDLDAQYTTPDDEDRHALLRGLLVTGFLIDAFFLARPELGVTQAVVMSASSKTALGFAHCAKARGATRLVGATSASNRAFVEGTGLYDAVVTYDELATSTAIDTDATSAVVDMAGAGAAVAAVHARLGDRIAHSMVVGKSHHDAPPEAVPAGPQPSMFFAPSEIEGRIAEWGGDGYATRIREALTTFIDGSRQWLTIETARGPEAAQAAWTRLHAGDVAPDIGLIASMHA